MLTDDQRINRYGAKFFIGQMVRVVQASPFHPDDDGKVGVVDGIVGSADSGFSYALRPTDTEVFAWLREDQLDFVVRIEREEWELHSGKKEGR